MSRMQPVGQKRLTNVCVVRYKRCGKRFEVACYKNTVVAWRNKVETDIDEVLQVHTIYENLDRGILAKREDMLEAFGNDDEDKICVEILNKGEFQVSEQERQMQLDALIKDVATRVTDMCLNPETQLPYPLSTIERYMRETLHFVTLPLVTCPARAGRTLYFATLSLVTRHLSRPCWQDSALCSERDALCQAAGCEL